MNKNKQKIEKRGAFSKLQTQSWLYTVVWNTIIQYVAVLSVAVSFLKQDQSLLDTAIIYYYH